jgi:DNA-directed RNA polymerase subunit RPC12/RpoP
MISRSLKCPECGAPIRLGQAQRHCECVNCGQRFAVGLSDGRKPQLTPFEVLVAQGLNGVSVQTAEQRLNELDRLIGQAEDAVEEKHGQLEVARAAYQARRAEVQEIVAPAQNRTYLTGLIAVAALFLVWFVFEGLGWLLALGVGITSLLSSWAFHSKWLGAEAWGKGELAQLRKRTEESEAGLSDAYMQLEDCVLERELRQRQLAGRRSSN